MLGQPRRIARVTPVVTAVAMLPPIAVSAQRAFRLRRPAGRALPAEDGLAGLAAAGHGRVPVRGCEEVPWSAIGSAVEDGARDVRSVKGVTRCGMGYCQGRICGPVLQQAVASATRRSPSEVGDLQSRPIMAPTALGVIAVSPGRSAESRARSQLRQVTVQLVLGDLAAVL